MLVVAVLVLVIGSTVGEALIFEIGHPIPEGSRVVVIPYRWHVVSYLVVFLL